MSAAARAAGAMCRVRRVRLQIRRARRSRHLVDELGGLTAPEQHLAAQTWLRAPDLDRRISRGDDFAGDAWISQGGEIRYVAVGHRPDEEGA